MMVEPATALPPQDTCELGQKWAGLHAVREAWAGFGQGQVRAWLASALAGLWESHDTQWDTHTWAGGRLQDSPEPGASVSMDPQPPYF